MPCGIEGSESDQSQIHLSKRSNFSPQARSNQAQEYGPVQWPASSNLMQKVLIISPNKSGLSLE